MTVTGQTYGWDGIQGTPDITTIDNNRSLMTIIQQEFRQNIISDSMIKETWTDSSSLLMYKYPKMLFLLKNEFVKGIEDKNR